ncbi:MAG: hypothetical protein HY722_06760 [Planctomycetes bacterium]|nr:hypothetical protein [Planctomycetota bacterium]
MYRRTIVWGAWVVLVLSPGCTGGSASPATAVATGTRTGTAPSVGAKAWDPALGTATVRGVVRFEGEAPRRRPLQWTADPVCQSQHAEPLLDESVVVGAGGGLHNVFVWVKEGLGTWSFPVPGTPATLEQRGCVYLPHVLGLQVGQTLNVRNADPTMHNVHAVAEVNESFNLSQSRQGMETPKTFTDPEVMVRVKCDVHGWMGAYVGVVPHPFHVVTGDDGTFSLAGLPPGRHVLEAWHEVYGAQSQELTIADKESRELAFTFREGK